MTRLIGILALALPFLEIAGFVWIGGKLGVVLTLAWVIGAMAVGLLLLRRTGLNAVGEVRSALAEGREPGHSLLDSACFAAAALLLIIPGFVSDALAVILMLPVTRNWLLRRTAAHFETRVYRRGGVIHGDFTVMSDDDPANSAGGGETAPKPPRQLPERKIIDID